VIWPDVADLVVIAGRTLGLAPRRTLDLLDVTAAEAALAEAHSGSDGSDPAAGAAALLHALLRHHPFGRGSRQIAVVATLQFLTLNGWRADLDPPEAAMALIADLATGSFTVTDFAAWLAPRLALYSKPVTKEAPMRGWIPRRRRAGRPLFQRFTNRARQAVILAQDEARRLSHNYIGTEHILLGLVAEGDGVAAQALESVGIGLAAVRREVEEIIGQGRQSPAAHIPFTPRAKKALSLALREALELGHHYIGTEHILLGLIREGDGVAAQVLAKLGADHHQVRSAVIALLASHGSQPGEPQRREPRAREQQGREPGGHEPPGHEPPGHEPPGHEPQRHEPQRHEPQRRGAVPPSLPGDVEALREEVHRLRREVTRLQDLVLRRDIEPGGGNQQSA
jgi:prophage maintenance system killer protein